MPRALASPSSNFTQTPAVPGPLFVGICATLPDTRCAFQASPISTPPRTPSPQLPQSSYLAGPTLLSTLRHWLRAFAGTFAISPSRKRSPCCVLKFLIVMGDMNLTREYPHRPPSPFQLRCAETRQGGPIPIDQVLATPPHTSRGWYPSRP